MDNLLERINALSPQQRALFEARLKKKGLRSPRQQKIPRRNDSNLCSLSIDQERLWVIDQLQPGTPAYNISAAVRLKGLLRISALTRSLGEILRRHEILRTAFPSIGGTPVQAVNVIKDLQLPFIDLINLPERAREAELHRLMTVITRAPFDMANGPLLRVVLLRLGAEEHALLITMHHIITDRWSFAVLWRELATLYKAYCAEQTPTLPELPIQFADYAVWQRQRLQGEVFEQHLSYWKTQLSGASFVLNLSSDHPRPAHQSFRGKRLFWKPPAALWEKLKALSQREGVTMYMTILAAYNILLHRYTGQQDILVGSPFANRDWVETEGLIGYLLTMLVLRTSLTGDPTVLELLARVRKTALEAYDHHDMPFGKLVEELQTTRDVSRNPLFQVAFVLVDLQDVAVELPDLLMTSLEVQSGSSRFDLMLGLRDKPGNPTLLFEYNTDLFDAATISRMKRHLEVLLEGIVADPWRRLSQVPWMPASERRQLLVKWNPRQAEKPPDGCIHELFESQAAQTPNNTALVFEDDRLSYDELNRRANQWAQWLRTHGVGPEVRVGIRMEPSIKLIIGLLGILKAGGAYVGLDPAWPARRLSFVLEDAQVSLLLTEEKLAQGVADCGVKVIAFDSGWHEIERSGGEELSSGTTGNNLAYVIYTSGSTGLPKGVAGEHQQLLSYLHGIRRVLKPVPGDSFAMHQTLAVDAPLTFIWAALTTGGILHLISLERAADPTVLGDYFQRHKIDYFKTAPSHLAALQTTTRDERIFPRRLLLLGGEASRSNWIDGLRSVASACAIVNHYGPTETTCGVATYRVPTTKKMHSGQTLPLGRPLINSRIYVLDAQLNLVPIGIPGEIYIGGEGVTRGYFRRPKLTGEKFIPDPFSGLSGARMYKTGDLGRYLADGNVEFLGRMDHQVKIRGFRVELGEIEAVMADHPAVRSAAVVAHDDDAGGKYLVGYVVGQDGSSLSAGEVRAYLKERLPAYMVPASVVRLEWLPLTPQGKIDRRALLASGAVRQESEREFVAAETPIEKRLAEIWSTVLKVKPSVTDNFFELGGHSLLATQVISRLREAFRMDLPLRCLFEHPTIQGLAQWVEENKRDNLPLQMSAIVPLSRELHRTRRSL